MGMSVGDSPQAFASDRVIIGHVGVAFAARRRWQSIPLPWLLGASLAPDLWRGILALTGLHWRDTNLYSHVLPWSAFLTLALAAAAFVALRDRKSAAVIGALVLSHIALDMISGWKELWPGGPGGLDIEHFEQLEFIIEAVLAWIGWKLLHRSSAPRWVSSWPVLALLVTIQASYLVVSFQARPWKTRCIAYPLSPCWSHF